MDSSELPSRNSAEQEETSKLVEIELMAPEWTDEKHCLFLKSMESTFVNQLYKSIEKFGLQSHTSSASRSKPLKQKQTSTRTSGQFKVLRDGYWSKVDFQKDESEHDQGEECKVPLLNPWIQRYRNSKIQAIKRCPSSSAKAPLAMPTSSSPPPCEDFNSNNIEMSDQNFNDEALAEEKSAKTDETKITRGNDQRRMLEWSAWTEKWHDRLQKFCNKPRNGDNFGRLSKRWQSGSIPSWFCRMDRGCSSVVQLVIVHRVST